LRVLQDFVNNPILLTVGVAQLVEHLVVAQVAVGSSPITHPIKNKGHCSANVVMAFLLVRFKAYQRPGKFAVV
jgi:hypothetical protein